MVAFSRNFLKYTYRYLLGLVLLLSMTQLVFNNEWADNSRVAYAASTESSTSESDTDINRVYDDAGLLSPSEIEKLEALSREKGELSGLEIIILTHNDSESTYPEEYIEDFEDQLPVGDRVYFLYDVFRGEIFMEGYGLAETYIHSKRIDKIFDKVVDDLKAKNYYDAFNIYITMSAAYMEDDSELNYDHDYIYDSPPEGFDPNDEYSYDEYNYDQHYTDEEIRSRDDNNYNNRKGEPKDSIYLNFWVQLIIALVIGAGVVGIFAYRSGGRMTTSGNDYLDKSRIGLIGRSDTYIRSTVTRRRKPVETDTSSSGGSRGGFSSGGFRGGSSSGGRSHSSGGRKL